jgi:hypothetical protein
LKFDKKFIDNQNLIMFFDMKTLIIVDLTATATPRLEGFIDDSLRDFLDLFHNSFFKARNGSKFSLVYAILEIPPEEVIQRGTIGGVGHPFRRGYKRNIVVPKEFKCLFGHMGRGRVLMEEEVSIRIQLRDIFANKWL